VIKVTVELLPFGTEIGKETLSEICIGNVGKCDLKTDPDGLMYDYTYHGWVKNIDDMKRLYGDESKFKGSARHYRCNGVLHLLLAVLEEYLL
jgi:hypothetical protein